jgi:hypothetical protein
MLIATIFALHLDSMFGKCCGEPFGYHFQPFSSYSLLQSNPVISREQSNVVLIVGAQFLKGFLFPSVPLWNITERDTFITVG